MFVLCVIGGIVLLVMGGVIAYAILIVLVLNGVFGRLP